MTQPRPLLIFVPAFAHGIKSHICRGYERLSALRAKAVTLSGEDEADPAWSVFNSILVAALLAATCLRVWECSLVNTNALLDDNLITMTYAKHLAEGGGFCFNAGESSLGTTTPLWTFALAAIATVTGMHDLRLFVSWATCLCMVLAAWSLMFLRKSFNLRPAEAAMAGIMGLLGTQEFTWGGELPGLQLLLLVTLHFMLSRRWVLAGAFTTLLFLQRGEGALLVVVVGLYLLAVHWKQPVHRLFSAGALFAVGVAVPMLIWVGYANIAFGQIFPSTVAAKMGQGAWYATKDASGLFFPDLIHRIHHLNSWGWLNTGPGRTAIATLVGMGVAYALIARRRMLGLLLWGVLYVTAYSAMGLPAIYTWYYCSFYWVASTFLGFGFAACLYLALFFARFRNIWRAAIVFLFLVFAATRAHALMLQQQRTSSDPRAIYYVPAMNWLNEHAAPHDTIACSEVGYIGYYTNLRVLDMCGLINPPVNILFKGIVSITLQYCKPDFYLIWTPVPLDGGRPQLHFGDQVYERVAKFPTVQRDRFVFLYKHVTAN